MNFYLVIKVLQIEVKLALLSEYRKRGVVCTIIRLSQYRKISMYTIIRAVK